MVQLTHIYAWVFFCISLQGLQGDEQAQQILTRLTASEHVASAALSSSMTAPPLESSQAVGSGHDEIHDKIMEIQKRLGTAMSLFSGFVV